MPWVHMQPMVQKPIFQEIPRPMIMIIQTWRKQERILTLATGTATRVTLSPYRTKMLWHR
jgi:hypothetical protein